MTQVMCLYEMFLLQDPPSLSRLVLADKYGLTKLSKVCIEHVKKQNMEALEKEKMYNQIDSASKVEILDYNVGRLLFNEGQSAQRIKTLSASYEESKRI